MPHRKNSNHRIKPRKLHARSMPSIAESKKVAECKEDLSQNTSQFTINGYTIICPIDLFCPIGGVPVSIPLSIESKSESKDEKAQEHFIREVQTYDASQIVRWLKDHEKSPYTKRTVTALYFNSELNARRRNFFKAQLDKDCKVLNDGKHEEALREIKKLAGKISPQAKHDLWNFVETARISVPIIGIWSQDKVPPIAAIPVSPRRIVRDLPGILAVTRIRGGDSTVVMQAAFLGAIVNFVATEYGFSENNAAIASYSVGAAVGIYHSLKRRYNLFWRNNQAVEQERELPQLLGVEP